MKLKTRTTVLLSICMAVVLALNATGCNVFTAQTPQEQLTVLAYDVSVVRAVVAAQPPGPKRDALLKQLDQVSNYTTLAAVVVALTQAGATPTTLPSDTAARIIATK